MISILIILVLLPSFLLGEERTLEKFPSCLFNRCVASNCLTSFLSPIEYRYQIYVFAFTRRSYNFSMFTFITFFVSLLSACLWSKEVGVLYLTVVRTNSMYLYAYMYLYRYQLFVFVWKYLSSAIMFIYHQNTFACCYVTSHACLAPSTIHCPNMLYHYCVHYCTI